MKKRTLVWIIIIVVLVYPTWMTFESIGEWAVWRDVPDDYIDIEAEEIDWSGKIVYSYVIASLPFLFLLSLLLYIINRLIREIRQQD